MPKKAPEKKTKKVTKVKVPTKAPVKATTESTIESLPVPTVEPVKLETNEIAPPLSSAVSTEATLTPAPTNVATPSAPTITPAVITEPDPTTGVTTDSLTATTLPTPAVTMSETTPVAGSDDFEPEHKGNGMKVLLIFLTALIVGGGAVAGFMYFSQMKPVTNDKKIVVTPTKAPTIEIETPIASESAEATDTAKLSVQILNGSGTPGEAARVRDLLQEAGFETFSLGNADSYEYTDTEVQVKEDVAGVFDKVKEALTSYTVVEKDTLPKTSDYDVVVVIGKHK